MVAKPVYQAADLCQLPLAGPFFGLECGIGFIARREIIADVACVRP